MPPIYDYSLSPMSVSEPDKDTKVLISKVGEIFTISLNSNPTAGYSWVPVIKYDSIKVVERKFEPLSGKIGGGGLEIFKVVSSKEGIYEIELEYKRPWDDNPIKIYKYLLNVESL